MTNGMFESNPARLARLLTTEMSSRALAVRRNKSSEHCVQTAVVAGRRVEPTPSLRLPRLPSDTRPLAPPLKKKAIGGVTPRLKPPPDPSEPPAVTVSMSSTLKLPPAKEVDPTTDFIHRVNEKIQRLHHTRVSCSHSPERREEQKTEEWAMGLMEVETVEEQDEKRVEEVKEENCPQKEEVSSSATFMTRKRKIGSLPRALQQSVDTEKLPPKTRKPKGSKLPDPTVLSLCTLCTELNTLVAHSTGLSCTPADCNYRCYIGPGNNNQLIAFLMKRRWFWTRVDSWQMADFIWTQHKRTSITEKLERRETAATVDVEETQQIGMRRRGKNLSEAEKAKAGLILISSSQSYVKMPMNASGSVRVYNRIDRNHQLTSKKRLFLNMQNYYQSIGEDVFSYLPLTFLIKDGASDPEFARFRAFFHETESDSNSRSERPKAHNLWIIKPGENTNCGHGIHVSSDISEIATLVSFTMTVTGRRRTYIVQKYLERPLLVNKRKFDIRGYGLVTSVSGHVQGYFYHDGYLRTSSKEFTLKNISNRFIHLTNDAVQKKSEDYGKFENGNKISYPEFQKYLEANYPGQVNFYTDIWPQIKRLVTDSFKATYSLLDPLCYKNTFEVLGYDFMIDEKFKVWLIEVNTNPCLALSSAYLAKLIPAMLDNAFRIAVDPYFLEPYSKKHQWEWSSQPFENRFELVFSSLHDASSRSPLCEDALSCEDSEASSDDAN